MTFQRFLVHTSRCYTSLYVVCNGKVRGSWGTRPSHGGIRATALKDPLPLLERRARFCGARRAKKFIEQELEANQAMIPQRIDNLKKTRDAAKRQQIVPGNGVQFITLAYERQGALAFEQFASLPSPTHTASSSIPSGPVPDER